MFKFKKAITVLVSVMMVAALLAGCGSKPSNSGGTTGKDTLVVAQGSDAKSLDPHATNDQPSSRVMKQIYDTLVVADEDMKIGPGLAESYKQLDPKTWEFTLRKGVKFHNGEELKAKDVKFSLERMLKSNHVKHIVETIDKVEALEDYKVIVKLKQPFGPILSHLAHTAAAIINEKAVTEAGDKYGQNPTGTGPYKFTSWKSGDRIELEAYAGHYKGAPKVKKVTFRNIVEGTNRAIAVETGEVDMAYDIDPADKDKIKNGSKTTLVEEPSLSMVYIGFNTNKAPFNKKEVRQAINHAVDRDSIIKAVLNGAGEVAGSPIGPKVFGHNTSIKPYAFDKAKAKELLKAAGLENGFKTTIWTNDNPVRVQIAQIVQAQLKEIGIDVKIDILEWGSYLDRTAKGEHDMFILGWVSVTGDADYGLYPIFHSSAKGAAGNRFFYDNKEVDKLLDAGRIAIDPEARKKEYTKVQEIVINEAPLTSIYYQTQNVGMTKSVKGFRMHPGGHHSLFNVSF